MTDLQFFAFVWLPLGVCVFGVVLAGLGMTLIDRIAPRNKPDELGFRVPTAPTPREVPPRPYL